VLFLPITHVHAQNSACIPQTENESIDFGSYAGQRFHYRPVPDHCDWILQRGSSTASVKLRQYAIARRKLQITMPFGLRMRNTASSLFHQLLLLDLTVSPAQRKIVRLLRRLIQIVRL
jgi:hypothetical protein